MGYQTNNNVDYRADTMLLLMVLLLMLSCSFCSDRRFLRIRSFVIRIRNGNHRYGRRRRVLYGNCWLPVIPSVVVMLLRMLLRMLPMLNGRIPSTVLLVLLLLLLLRRRAFFDSFLDWTKMDRLFLVHHMSLMTRSLLNLLQLLVMMLLLLLLLLLLMVVMQLLLLMLLLKQMGRLRSLLPKPKLIIKKKHYEI